MSNQTLPKEENNLYKNVINSQNILKEENKSNKNVINMNKPNISDPIKKNIKTDINEALYKKLNWENYDKKSNCK